MDYAFAAGEESDGSEAEWHISPYSDKTSGCIKVLNTSALHLFSFAFMLLVIALTSNSCNLCV